MKRAQRDLPDGLRLRKELLKSASYQNNWNACIDQEISELKECEQSKLCTSLIRLLERYKKEKFSEPLQLVLASLKPKIIDAGNRVHRFFLSFEKELNVAEKECGRVREFKEAMNKKCASLIEGPKVSKKSDSEGDGSANKEIQTAGGSEDGSANKEIQVPRGSPEKRSWKAGIITSSIVCAVTVLPACAVPVVFLIAANPSSFQAVGSTLASLPPLVWEIAIPFLVLGIVAAIMVAVSKNQYKKQLRKIDLSNSMLKQEEGLGSERPASSEEPEA